jgi:hypothetical protein
MTERNAAQLEMTCNIPTCENPTFPMQKPMWGGRNGQLCRAHSRCYRCLRRTEWTCIVCQDCDRALARPRGPQEDEDEEDYVRVNE